MHFKLFMIYLNMHQNLFISELDLSVSPLVLAAPTWSSWSQQCGAPPRKEAQCDRIGLEPALLARITLITHSGKNRWQVLKLNEEVIFFKLYLSRRWITKLYKMFWKMARQKRKLKDWCSSQGLTFLTATDWTEVCLELSIKWLIVKKQFHVHFPLKCLHASCQWQTE